MGAEITLDGLQFSVLNSEILHVAERFTVLGVAKILHKSIVRARDHSLDLEASDEINLCVPASGFESALADVVVAGGAGEGEVVGKQEIEGGQVLIFPSRVPLTDELVVGSVMGRVVGCVIPCRCAGPCQSGRLTVAANAQAPVASRFLRDTAVLVMVFVLLFMIQRETLSPRIAPLTV